MKDGPRMVSASERTAQGWVYESEGRCKAEECDAEIEWWRTKSGKLSPLDSGTLISHFATCKALEKFRRKG